MDKISLDYFNFLLSKELIELTQDEIGFLKARRDAMNPIQKEFYKSILEDKKEEPKPEIKENKKVKTE